ncbi:MAG: BMP family ABC transporter substrate-binding protein, partial [Oscillochloris sp.]|nr:BMP family ABC transporter substrate-binding protein [Oscillochloris sp.]
VDDVQGASTAEQLIGEGVDVIFGAGGKTGTGGILAAAAKGIYVIGVDQDEYVTSFASGKTPGADKILTSAVKRVDVGVYDQIKAIVDGTFKGNRVALYEAANGGVGFAPYHDAESAIPDAVKARIEEIEKALADGTLSTGVDSSTGDLDEAMIPVATPFKP